MQIPQNIAGSYRKHRCTTARLSYVTVLAFKCVPNKANKVAALNDLLLVITEQDFHKSYTVHKQGDFMVDLLSGKRYLISYHNFK